MRWLAVVSVLLLTGCSSVQPQVPIDSAVVVHPPASLDRPWLIPMPRDELTLLDTRTLQALRKADELPALNANGNGRVKRPGLWAGIGLGAVATGLLVAETMDADSWCFLGSDCD